MESTLRSITMVATADPDSMTTAERRREVASILAQGLLRRVRAARETLSKAPPNRLEPGPGSRLSVAPQPAG